MATGRLIQTKICRSKTIHDLSSDTSRLGFTWYIIHADRDGRVPADPAVVKSLVFPRRTDITITDMEAMLREWHDSGLIVIYEARGDVFAYFPEFHNNQSIRYDREAESVIPPPPEDGGTTPERRRSNSGAAPAEFKRKESKRKEGKPQNSINLDWPEEDDA